MIQTSSTMRILVAIEPVDFRKGIDGLAGWCRQKLQQDPLSGCAFVFRNRKGPAVKVLVYDGQGFWLCQNGSRRGASPGGPPTPRPAARWRPINCRSSWPAATPRPPAAFPSGARSRSRSKPAQKICGTTLAF